MASSNFYRYYSMSVHGGFEGGNFLAGPYFHIHFLFHKFPGMRDIHYLQLRRIFLVLLLILTIVVIFLGSSFRFVQIVFHTVKIECSVGSR